MNHQYLSDNIVRIVFRKIKDKEFLTVQIQISFFVQNFNFDFPRKIVEIFLGENL